jgi:hypothetical protein
MHNKSTVALPPKKRKRRRILRQDIVFSFADHDEDELPSDADYYCFPKDALVETIADDPPFEVIFLMMLVDNNFFHAGVCWNFPLSSSFI